MSLTNPNKPVTEARLQEFYQQIKSYLGLREMPSGDMDEIVSPKPVTAKGGHRYSTDEQIVGTWIDGSTIYEKTIESTTPSELDTYITLTTISNLNKCLDFEGYTVDNSGNYYPIVTNRYFTLLCKTTGEVRCGINSNTEFLSKPIKFVIRYTKTA